MMMMMMIIINIIIVIVIIIEIHRGRCSRSAAMLLLVASLPQAVGFVDDRNTSHLV